MQAFAGDRPGLLPTRFQRTPNTSISNEKRMNLPSPFECRNTRHWPVFNDQGGSISAETSTARSGLPTIRQLGSQTLSGAGYGLTLSKAAT